jgi:ABC-type multidrug transport system fused ATPase/permease subunit
MCGHAHTWLCCRLNVRLRKALFHSLLAAEIGFYDVTKASAVGTLNCLQPRSHTFACAFPGALIQIPKVIAFHQAHGFTVAHHCCLFGYAMQTGEITSRLSTDTSSVSDSVCLNLNVMLRR